MSGARRSSATTTGLGMRCLRVSELLTSPMRPAERPAMMISAAQREDAERAGCGAEEREKQGNGKHGGWGSGKTGRGEKQTGRAGRSRRDPFGARG